MRPWSCLMSIFLHLQSWLGMPYIHGMWGSLEKSDQENEGSQPKPGLHNHHLVFIQCLPSKTFSTSCLSCFSFLVLLRRLEPLFFWRVLTSFGRASCKHISFLCATCHGGFWLPNLHDSTLASTSTMLHPNGSPTCHSLLPALSLRKSCTPTSSDCTFSAREKICPGNIIEPNRFDTLRKKTGMNGCTKCV